MALFLRFLIQHFLRIYLSPDRDNQMKRYPIDNSLSFLPARLSLIFSLVTLLILLFGQANAADLTLAWDASPDSDVSVYRVYHRTQSNPFTTHAYEGSNLSCTISGLTEGQTYYFVATAINSYGESNYSGEILTAAHTGKLTQIKRGWIAGISGNR